MDSSTPANNKNALHQQRAKEAKQQRQTWKPKSHAKEAIADKQCPFCHKPINSGYALCPHCGHSLTPGKCSFCGAAMKAGARFCTHCGQSAQGIVCSECGTFNARNFCRRCNAPLTDMALRAVKQAASDPAFKAVEAKARELAELYTRIQSMKNGSQGTEKTRQLSEADRAMLNEYADLLGLIGAYKPADSGSSSAEIHSETNFKDTSISFDEIMASYREKAAEMDAALAAMTPPAEFSPEQQRDYYSARQVVSHVQQIDLEGYQSVMWQCNFCGALHNNPSNCSAPELGGKWIYVSPEEFASLTLVHGQC